MAKQKPTIRYRVLVALYNRRRPRTAEELLEFLNTESPGPQMKMEKLQTALRFMAYARLIRWVEDSHGYLRNRSKCYLNVGKPWSKAEDRQLDEWANDRTPLRIMALKLRRMEEEIVRRRPAFGSRKK